MWTKGKAVMTKQEMSSDAANQDARIKELTDENGLLFDQLHVVQEELEKYYHKLKECEQRKGTAMASSSLPLDSFEPRLPEALAENQKLLALVEQQKIALRVETQNSLPGRLGEMLIKGVSSTGAFFALPGNLRKMWKALERTTPPAELGGKSFQKVVDTYGAGGADAVETLLESVFIAPPMRANAYTALARQLMLSDVKKAAAIARLAWETDPSPYRLKWLAFRVHDAGDAVTAEALLDMLPADIPMSESEQRQAMRIRQESANQRKKKAENDAGVQKQKNAENQKIAQLIKQAEEQRREADRLRQQQKETQKLADARQADLKALQARLVEQERLAAARAKESTTFRAELEGLRSIAKDRKADAEALQVRLTEQETLTANKMAEIDALKVAQAGFKTFAHQYEQEAGTLRASLVEQETLAASRAAEIDALKKAHEGLQAIADDYKTEADALQARLTEQETLAASRAAEIDALKKAHEGLQAIADDYKLKADTLQVRLSELEALATTRKEESERIATLYEMLQKSYNEVLKDISNQQKEIFSAVTAQSSQLVSGFEKQIMDLERVRKAIQGECKKEIDFALQQTVAYNGLTQYFESGKFPEVTPWKRGWPASPDFILWLVELIDKNNYDLILEFGSGITTLYTAKALSEKCKNIKAKGSTTAVAFEHLEQFFLQTKDILAQADLSDHVNISHAPLREYAAPNGTTYQYYSCQETLSALSVQYKSAESRLLVIVDGPPGATNKNARYPAFPLVMQYFSPAHIDFLLDDYIRGDEKELAGMWKAACATAGIEHIIVEKQLEKEALLLRTNPIYGVEK